MNGFTQLGLVEMTRKRTRESLAHVLCEPCPTCQRPRRGQDARRRSATTSCARSCARRGSSTPREFRILASQSVIDMFLDEEIAEPRAARRLHRQADLAAGRDDLHAGAVRHRADLTAALAQASRRNRIDDSQALVRRARMGGAPVPAQARRARPFRGRTASCRGAAGWRSRRGLAVARLPGLRAARLRRLEARGRCWCCCHGCRQTPRISPQARASRRSPTATAGWCCCRGSRAQPTRGAAGTGSTSRPVARPRRSGDRRRADPRRAPSLPRAPASAIFVAGMSAGGCARRRARPALSERCSRGVAVHSGVACGAASSAVAAMQVMRTAPTTTSSRSPRRARGCASACAAVSRCWSCTAATTDVVASVNAAAAGAPVPALQRAPRRRGRRLPTTLPLARPGATRQLAPATPRRRAIEYVDGRARWFAACRVDGLGHAWSGGDARLPVQRSAAGPTRSRCSVLSLATIRSA